MKLSAPIEHRLMNSKKTLLNEVYLKTTKSDMIIILPNLREKGAMDTHVKNVEN